MITTGKTSVVSIFAGRFVRKYISGENTFMLILSDAKFVNLENNLIYDIDS